MLITPRRTRAHLAAALLSGALATIALTAAARFTASAQREAAAEPGDESEIIAILPSAPTSPFRFYSSSGGAFPGPTIRPRTIICPAVATENDERTLEWVKHSGIGYRLWGVPARLDRTTIFWIVRGPTSPRDYLDQLKAYGPTWICPNLDDLQSCLDAHSPRAAAAIRLCTQPNRAFQTSRTLWQAPAALAARALGIATLTLSALALAWLLASRLTLHRRTRRGHCPACGYDLTTTPAPLCPECGAPRKH